MKKAILAFCALAGCTAAPTIEATHDYAAPEARAGQSPGYCVEYTYEGCDIPASEAMAICEQTYGNVMVPISPMECWQSNEAAAWGCAPVCGVRVTCPGAEQYPFDLWCCNW